MKKALSIILSLTFAICVLQPFSAATYNYAFAKEPEQRDLTISMGQYGLIFEEDSDDYDYDDDYDDDDDDDYDDDDYDDYDDDDYDDDYDDDDYDDDYDDDNSNPVYDQNNPLGMKSSDTNVVSVYQEVIEEELYDDDDWYDGTIYHISYYAVGIAPGTAVITYIDNNKYYAVNVTVTEPEVKNITVPAGGYKTLVKDIYETETDEVKSVASSDTSIAKIETKNTTVEEADRTYYVFGVSPGNTEVTYNYNGVEYKANVTVVKPTLSASKTTVKFTPKEGYYEEYDIFYNALGGLKVKSSDTSIVTSSIENYTMKDVRSDNYFISHNSKDGKLCHLLKLTPKKVGTATVKVFDDFGNSVQIKVNVTKEYMQSLIEYECEYDDLVYGKTSYKGVGMPYSSIKLKIDGKTYTAKADSNGKYTVKNIKICKIGTKFSVTYTSNGTSYTEKDSVEYNDPYLKYYLYYRNQTKFRGYVTDVHKGDVLKVTIGKNTYTKTFTKYYSAYDYSFKVKKNGNYGSKIKVRIVNKFGQTLNNKSSVIYYSKNVKNGMTKKQVRYAYNWGEPEDITQSSYGTTWWYYSGSYVHFNNKGRVDYWYKA